MWRNLPTTEPFGNSPVEDDPGNTGNHFEMPLAFAGQYRDKESGLNYNGARDYNSATGGYWQSDPIGLAGGSLSTFAYVNGNPLRFTDPMGLDVRDDIANRAAGLPSKELPEKKDYRYTITDCEYEWLNNTYGNVGGFITDLMNLQQYLPSAPSPGESLKTGIEVGAEKMAATRGVGAVGAAKGITPLKIFGAASSAALEVIGSGATTFATTAKKQAEEHCKCSK